MKFSHIIAALTARQTSSVMAHTPNLLPNRHHIPIGPTSALTQQIQLFTAATTPRPTVDNPSWITPELRSSHQFLTPNTSLSLRNAILPLVASLPENTSSSTVSTFSPPKKKLFSREEIIQLLQNTKLMKKLLATKDLKITPMPHTALTAHTALTDLAPAFKITLFGYSTFATIATRMGGEQIVKLGTIEIPLQEIQQALAIPTTNTDMLEAQPIVELLDQPQINAAVINERSETAVALDEAEDQPTISPTAESLLDQPALENSNDDAPVAIALLNSIIPKIQDPLIKRKTIAVNDALLNLPKDDETLKKVEKHLNCTYQALTAAPGTPREEAHAELKKLATEAKNSTSPAWQAVGIAMMLLGAVIYGLGVASLLTGFIPGIAFGLVFMGVGASIFSTGGDVFMSESSEHTSGQPEDLLTSTMLT